MYLGELTGTTSKVENVTLGELLNWVRLISPSIAVEVAELISTGKFELDLGDYRLKLVNTDFVAPIQNQLEKQSEQLVSTEEQLGEEESNPSTETKVKVRKSV